MDYKIETHIFGSFQRKNQHFTENLINSKLTGYLNLNENNHNKLVTYNNYNKTLIIFVENTSQPMSVTKMQDSIILNHNVNDNPELVIDYFLCLVAGDVPPVRVNVDQNRNESDIFNNPILQHLLPYQVPHVLQLYETMRHRNCVLDASDTGTGKTYMALALASMNKLKPFIICPKSVIYSWLSVAKKLNIEVLGISNYESLKSGKYYINEITESKKKKCPYVKLIGMNDNELEQEEQYYNICDGADEELENTLYNLTKKDKSQSINRNYEFNFPPNTLIIFDEAHRCKNFRSLTSKMLVSMVKANNVTRQNKILLLSATITDKILCFKPFGLVFGFYNDVIQFKNWLRRSLSRFNAKMIDDDIALKIINNAVFPQYGSRIRIKELGDLFPRNQVTAQLYFCNNVEEINQQYDIIKMAFEEYKLKQSSTSFPLAIILYARMKIELYKIPIIIDIALDAVENGYSVVIFVCFSETLTQLAAQLDTNCLIYGGQTAEERNACIDDFQYNRKNILIAMGQCGSTGLSLHDIHGGHPRMSIINPSWNGIELKQTLGRIHRAGSKSPALQRIVYCANTYEEKICDLIEAKIRNIDNINDGDMSQDDICKEMMKQSSDDMKFTKISEEEAIKLKDVEQNTNANTKQPIRKKKAAKLE
jgi:SNF2 family DNA or RNA helicase